MGALEIAVIVISVVFVLSVIVGSVIRKKKNKGSCCSGCAGCPYSCDCKDKADSTTAQKNKQKHT